MDTDVFASRVAVRFRLPIAGVGAASLVLAIANLLFDVVDDQLMDIIATVVGLAAVAMFLSAVLDMRFQQAVSAMNAERRTEARQKGRLSSLTGWGLPVGDRLLMTLNLCLLVLALIGANYFHRQPATALLVAAFALVGLAQIALVMGGQPTDRSLDPPA